MRPIKVHFERFAEVTLYQALSEIGVYVLWPHDPSTTYPYIGEGRVIDRLSSHDKNTKAVLDGVVAFMENKEDAQIAEALLIDCAKKIGLVPDPAQKSGHWSKVEEAVAEDNKVRVLVSGQDPFQLPNRPKLTATKWIEAYEEDDEVVFACPWNHR